MNGFISEHPYITIFVILAIFGWVIYKRLSKGGPVLITFVIVTVIVWLTGTFAFIYFRPYSMYYGVYKRAVTAIINQGVGANTSSGSPVNSLYAVPYRSSPSAPRTSLLATGTDDVLYIVGWLDLSKGQQVLHVPDFSGRYYSVQFTDPSDGADFAFVGTRTTGMAAGNYLLTGPNWKGKVPGSMTLISSPNNSVLVLGRVRVTSNDDVPAAYGLAKQIQLTPLSH